MGCPPPGSPTAATAAWSGERGLRLQALMAGRGSHAVSPLSPGTLGQGCSPRFRHEGVDALKALWVASGELGLNPGLQTQPGSPLPSASLLTVQFVVGPVLLGHLPDGAAEASSLLTGLCWASRSNRTGCLVPEVS